MMPPTSDSLHLFEFVVGRLRPHGWEVERSSGDEYFNIEVEHPLTSRSTFGFPDDGGDHREFVEKQLARREFRLMEKRPREIPHQSLLGKIRVAAQANQWDQNVVTVISRILASEGLLTPNESEWLEAAGPAWSEN